MGAQPDLAAEPEPLPQPPLVAVAAGVEAEVGQVHCLAPGAGVLQLPCLGDAAGDNFPALDLRAGGDGVHVHGLGQGEHLGEPLGVLGLAGGLPAAVVHEEIGGGDDGNLVAIFLLIVPLADAELVVGHKEQGIEMGMGHRTVAVPGEGLAELLVFYLLHHLTPVQLLLLHAGSALHLVHGSAGHVLGETGPLLLDHLEELVRLPGFLVEPPADVALILLFVEPLADLGVLLPPLLGLLLNLHLGFLEDGPAVGEQVGGEGVQAWQEGSQQQPQGGAPRPVDQLGGLDALLLLPLALLFLGHKLSASCHNLLALAPGEGKGGVLVRGLGPRLQAAPLLRLDDDMPLGHGEALRVAGLPQVRAGGYPGGVEVVKGGSLATGASVLEEEAGQVAGLDGRVLHLGALEEGGQPLVPELGSLEDLVLLLVGLAALSPVGALLEDRPLRTRGRAGRPCRY